MVQHNYFPELDAKQERLIACLLQCATKEAAARKASVPHNTMYRWLRDPRFMAAYREARRRLFDDGLMLLEVNTGKAVWALVKELKGKDSRSAISAAKAIIDFAFKAQDSIAIQEEMAYLRSILEKLKAGQAPTAPKPPEAPKGDKADGGSP